MIGIRLMNSLDKNCDGCTKCCEGYLSANIKGHEMDFNKPCFFLKGIGIGCGDYKNRPEDPCQVFKCGWLQDDDNSIPDWMKPNLSNAIILLRIIDGERVLKLRQCGNYIEPNVIAWFFQWALERTNNIEISLFDNVYFYGETLKKAVAEHRYKG